MTTASFDYCGIILTRMRWDRPLWWIFNLSLFAYQLIMLSVGKLVGKVKPIWPEIWWAAQMAHVRLLLNPEPGHDTWRAISFAAPEAKYDWWSPGSIVRSNGHFIYLEPTFEPDQEMINRISEAAEAKMKQPVARKYDYLQILSFLVNLPIWIFYWPAWGKEVIKIMNLPGGREVCSSGIAAILRWATRLAKIFRLRFINLWTEEEIAEELSLKKEEVKADIEYIRRSDLLGQIKSGIVEFFAGYAIAMVCPALFAISRNWKKVKFGNG